MAVEDLRLKNKRLVDDSIASVDTSLIKVAGFGAH